MGLICLPRMNLMYPKSANWDLAWLGCLKSHLNTIVSVLDWFQLSRQLKNVFKYRCLLESKK